MELWIRSQNKEILAKIINFSVVEYKDEFRIVGFSADEMDESDLGCYETKERALEILDEIQNIMKPVIMYSPVVKDMTKPEDSYKRMELESYNSSIEMLDTYVYEMPEE